MFHQEPPKSRKDLYDVIVSQLPNVQAELIGRFCIAVKNIDHAKLYNKMVTQADKKYGEFDLFSIDAKKELEQELMDAPVYMILDMIQEHYSPPKDATVKESGL